ncbi:MAG TPA: hypothetical protein ENN06_05550 [Desulfobacteraceae bacterium]|nr:hypothetical protein [Desulfobacteraceae bacterium]
MKTLIRCIILSAAVLILTGCAGGVGKPLLLSRTLEVNDIIESATILPGHRYYYAGPESKPDVIIAIDEKYTFRQSIHWHEVTPTEELLRSWNRIIDNRYRIKFPYYGAWILTPDGQKAGIWYSQHTNTVIEYPTPGEIIIYRPDSTVRKQRKLLWENRRR